MPKQDTVKIVVPFPPEDEAIEMADDFRGTSHMVHLSDNIHEFDKRIRDAICYKLPMFIPKPVVNNEFHGVDHCAWGYFVPDDVRQEGDDRMQYYPRILELMTVAMAHLAQIAEKDFAKAQRIIYRNRGLVSARTAMPRRKE